LLILVSTSNANPWYISKIVVSLLTIYNHNNSDDYEKNES